MNHQRKSCWSRPQAHLRRGFLVALSNQLKVDETELEALPGNVVTFRNMPLPEEIIRRAAELVSGQ